MEQTNQSEYQTIVFINCDKTFELVRKLLIATQWKAMKTQNRYLTQAETGI